MGSFLKHELSKAVVGYNFIWLLVWKISVDEQGVRGRKVLLCGSWSVLKSWKEEQTKDLKIFWSDRYLEARGHMDHYHWSICWLSYKEEFFITHVKRWSKHWLKKAIEKDILTLMLSDKISKIYTYHLSLNAFWTFIQDRFINCLHEL